MSELSIDRLLDQLPEHLRERTRAVSDHVSSAREMVLYWMRTAIRSEENPAIDVAASLANRLNLPLLVYHGLSQHYQYASDRHHTFMLQGAADVQCQLSGVNISYAFHLATPQDDAKHLVDLADRAVLVVTEDMPVDPPRRFLKALRAQTKTAIVCVDTACVVPMQLTDKPFTRAFEFRKATKLLYSDRVHRAWPEQKLNAQRFDLSKLPFQPIDFEIESVNELVAQCEIDHSVAPVVDTVGGSEAGYQRWESFKQSGLSGYASKRNNALIDGVSRMSPYLHDGMVSPMRIAREAAAFGGPGSEKFLDELLTWRELAHHFCFHREDHDQWSAISQWAQQTLKAHQNDPRSNIYSWEQLARAQTDDELWNAAQRSLLMQGELHNNVRMTWGKSILNWTADPENALHMMIDLNHRYALDGRDPASYGGLLWCLGQFDRPFEPERPILGTVRPRPAEQHAQRLDTQKYTTKATTPRFSPNPRVAIIGAGMSGTIAARTLLDHGVKVNIFEKSRHAGGRMATRRREGQPVFDHGAQYFTARDQRFARHVNSWRQQGVVAKWPEVAGSIVVMKNGVLEQKSDSVERFVGTPGMRSVVEHLASGMEINFRTTIRNISRDLRDQLYLQDADDNLYGPFDHVIVSIPAPQASALLATLNTEHCDAMLQAIKHIKMNPSWATMIRLGKPLDASPSWAGAFVHESLLGWIARDSSKPQRDTEHGESLVLHATAQWSLENLERDADEIAAEMLAEFWHVSGLSSQSPNHLQAHRWRHAIPVDPATERTLFSDDRSIGCCGDWLGGPRVEGAFLSGMAAAGRILGTLSADEQNEARPQQKQRLS